MYIKFRFDYQLTEAEKGIFEEIAVPFTYFKSRGRNTAKLWRVSMVDLGLPIEGKLYETDSVFGNSDSIISRQR